jgi:hypothetical protein
MDSSVRKGNLLEKAVAAIERTILTFSPSLNERAGGADMPPCGTVKEPGQAMDGTR